MSITKNRNKKLSKNKKRTRKHKKMWGGEEPDNTTVSNNAPVPNQDTSINESITAKNDNTTNDNTTNDNKEIMSDVATEPVTENTSNETNIVPVTENTSNVLEPSLITPSEDVPQTPDVTQTPGVTPSDNAYEKEKVLKELKTIINDVENEDNKTVFTNMYNLVSKLELNEQLVNILKKIKEKISEFKDKLNKEPILGFKTLINDVKKIESEPTQETNENNSFAQENSIQTPMGQEPVFANQQYGTQMFPGSDLNQQTMYNPYGQPQMYGQPPNYNLSPDYTQQMNGLPPVDDLMSPNGLPPQNGLPQMSDSSSEMISVMIPKEHFEAVQNCIRKTMNYDFIKLDNNGMEVPVSKETNDVVPPTTVPSTVVPPTTVPSNGAPPIVVPPTEVPLNGVIPNNTEPTQEYTKPLANSSEAPPLFPLKQ